MKKKLSFAIVSIAAMFVCGLQKTHAQNTSPSASETKDLSVQSFEEHNDPTGYFKWRQKHPEQLQHFPKVRINNAKQESVTSAPEAELDGLTVNKVVNFDDLSLDYSGKIPNPYEGFNWTTGPGTYTDFIGGPLGVTKGADGQDGYYAGTISTPNVAYNRWAGRPMRIEKPDLSAFTFVSGYFTAAWHTLHISFQGYNGSTLAKTSSVYTLSATTPTLVTLNWSDITSLIINIAETDTFSHVVMDDFTFGGDTPTVSLSTPYHIVKYSAPAKIKLNATATDITGKITKVEFYNGSNLLHTEDVFPYGFLWKDVPASNYTLTAKAFNNSGNVFTSKSLNILVAEENVPPVVSLVSPANNITYNAPATIHLLAQAKDPNDKISKVEFYRGETLIRTEYYYPYTYSWKNVYPGTYTITAKAYDEKGLSATSEPVTITVTNASIVSSRPSAENNKIDTKNAFQLKLSPNPARNVLQIQTNGLQLTKPSTISIISSSGVLVKTIENVSNQVLQIDVSSLKSGVYTIKIVSGDKVFYKQFVKL